MQSSDAWLQGVQYFRAIAVIEVIVGHALLVAAWTGYSTLGPLKQVIIVAFAGFTTFGVQHFVFISGVVLYNKYHNRFSLSTFYKRRFGAVLPPYLVWSTFYFFYGYVAALLFSVFHYQGVFSAYESIPNVTQLFSQYMKALATGVEHLWFVVLILQLYLLYPLLVKFYNRLAKQTNPVYVLSLLVLVQVVFTSFFVNGSRQNNSFSELFLTVIFYFVFGFYVAAHYQVITQKLAKVSLMGLSVAVLLSTICYTAFYYVPFHSALLGSTVNLFYCLLLIFFYLRICTALGEPHGFLTGYLEKIGEDSFGIYLIHYVFFLAFAGALPKLGLTPYNLLFYPTLAFLTLLLSYVSVQLLYRLPFATIIVGKRRKRQTPELPASTAPVPR
jgi:peptidoglycan/LPS O-acetylase OafA/YrhL